MSADSDLLVVVLGDNDKVAELRAELQAERTKRELAEQAYRSLDQSYNDTAKSLQAELQEAEREREQLRDALEGAYGWLVQFVPNGEDHIQARWIRSVLLETETHRGALKEERES